MRKQMTAHLCGIISTAIWCIDCIKPIVGGGCVVLKHVNSNNEIKSKLTSLNWVSYLIKCDWLRICQAHSIFKVNWTLYGVVGTLVSCLDNSWRKVCHRNISTREDKITNLHRLEWYEASRRPDWVKIPCKEWFNTYRRGTQISKCTWRTYQDLNLNILEV